MDISKLRQKVYQLDRQRRALLHQVLRLRAMISGSLYQMHRRCGNPRCKCARGQLHASWYVSEYQQGRTKLTYIGRVVPNWLSPRVHRYQRHQKSLARIRKIDAEISKTLTLLRDENVKSIHHIREDMQ